jgi:hypothetical protein
VGRWFQPFKVQWTSTDHLIFDPGTSFFGLVQPILSTIFRAITTAPLVESIPFLTLLVLSGTFCWLYRRGTLFDAPEDKRRPIELPTPFPWRCCRIKYRRHHRTYGCRQRSAALYQSLFDGSDPPFLKRLRTRLRSGLVGPRLGMKPRATHKHSRWRKRPPDLWATLDPDEAEQDRRADHTQLWPRMLRFSAVTYGLRYGVDLHAFVDGTDPLAQLSMLRQLSDPTLFGTARSTAQMNHGIDETVALAELCSSAPNNLAIQIHSSGSCGQSTT